MNDKVIGVIPARYGSTRLPGKALIEIAGKTLTQWVWEAASQCKSIDDLLIATDDQRIADACVRFGAKWVMTSPDCPSGSDRIAEAVRQFPHQVIVNIQGDEPLLDPAVIDRCVGALQSDRAAGVCSAMTPFKAGEDYTASSMVKVVTDIRGYAMYFSRAPIPDRRRLSQQKAAQAPAPMKHVGLYIYRRDVLDQFVSSPPSQYELLEKLEQLRLLEAGVKIKMITVNQGAVGVDTPEDVEIVEQLIRNRER